MAANLPIVRVRFDDPELVMVAVERRRQIQVQLRRCRDPFWIPAPIANAAIEVNALDGLAVHFCIHLLASV